jgi:hypothetical protein
MKLDRKGPRGGPEPGCSGRNRGDGFNFDNFLCYSPARSPVSSALITTPSISSWSARSRLVATTTSRARFVRFYRDVVGTLNCQTGSCSLYRYDNRGLPQWAQMLGCQETTGRAVLRDHNVDIYRRFNVACPPRSRMARRQRLR